MRLGQNEPSGVDGPSTSLRRKLSPFETVFLDRNASSPTTSATIPWVCTMTHEEVVDELHRDQEEPGNASA